TAGNAEIEGLLELLARASPAEAVPLIVIDGVALGTRAAVEVATLARAARSTHYFSLLVVGPAELSADLVGSQAASAVVAIPALPPRQVVTYIDCWLRATRSPDAPPLVVTIDAALIIGHRTGGNLERINALAREMIANGGPVVTSWDDWTAQTDAANLGAPPVRPPGWPTPEALHLINQCRAAAGLARRGAPDG